MFIVLVHKGIDGVLRRDLSSLIFKTMKICYKVDDSQIVSDPSLMERRLLKVMGKNAAEVTLAHIKEEVKRSIAFVF